MRNLRILVAYDGSKLFGWQRQDGFNTVQQHIEEALHALVGERVVVQGAGRTDTGVHALGQVAHFHADTRLEDDRLRHALNANLPGSVRIRRLETCPPDFHARFDALGKRYLYLVTTSRFQPPFARELVHWVHHPLDLGRMREAAALLHGKHDFRAFGNTGSPRATTVRTLRALRIVAHQRGFGVLAEADGFLYNMVRTLVGTLLAVGRGRFPPQQVREALESGRRELAGPTAPACGLYLVRVRYPESVFPGPDRGPLGAPGLFQL
ncbi:MAG: tRNA pseudouridine(38-40) synthase TruA [Planctomycetes bacterium]|nr:tRNA pseudouridine(38-40) synthase TruA [Planctomycetota bacterium]